MRSVHMTGSHPTFPTKSHFQGEEHCSDSEMEDVGRMRVVSWQGSRLVSSLELQTMFRELFQDTTLEKREMSFADLNRKQSRFVSKCATEHGLHVEKSFLTLRVSRSGHHRHKSNIQMSEIIEGFLYLGSANNLNDSLTMQAKKIKRVVNCAREFKQNMPHFNTMSTNWEDKEAQNIMEAFEEIFQFIDEAKGLNEPVFIHCMLGKSRSAALVIAYMMRSQGMSLRFAFHHVRSKRVIIKPNNGFMKQLITYERTITGETTFSMSDYVDFFHPKVSFVDILKTNANMFYQRRFDSEFFQSQYTKIFKDQIVQPKDIGTFIMMVSMNVNQDKELITELYSIQLQMTDISQSLANGCKDFFNQKMKTTKETIANDMNVHSL